MDLLPCSVSKYSQFEIGNSGASSVLWINEKKEVKNVEKCIENNFLHNIPVITAGPLAGYADLCMACIENKSDLVKVLVQDFKLSPNMVTLDGAHPLVIAGLLGHLEIVEILLKANANADVEFGQEVQSKYANDVAWCQDFGDKITLAIFAIMNNKNDLLRSLVNNSQVYLKFKSRLNKTLLMYAIENDNYENTEVFEMMGDKEFLNIRDNDGLSAIHYLFHKKKYGEFRYDEKQLLYEELYKQDILGFLMRDGANIYSMVDDDPETFLPNAMAYRGAYVLITYLLPHCTSITQSRALYYATLPMGDPKKYLRPYDEEPSVHDLDHARKNTIESILKDLINRRTFGFFVPEEEKQLMDKLIATDTNIKDLVLNYEKNFIHGSMKNAVIEYGDKSITFFDFVMKVGASDKKLKSFVKDEEFTYKFCYELNYDDFNFFWFLTIYELKIKQARIRIILLKELSNIPQLRKHIPVPYELVLEIIEYLNNDELEKFIYSFFK